MKNNWQVQDANGVIHSGTKEEMFDAFYCMTHSNQEIADHFDINYTEAQAKAVNWKCGWSGDLLLIEIHNRYK